MAKDQVKMATVSVYEGYNIKVPFLIAKNVVEMFGDDGWKILENSYKEFMKMPEGSITNRNMIRYPVLLVKNVAETIKLFNPEVQLEPFDQAKCLVYGDDCCEVIIKLP